MLVAGLGRAGDLGALALHGEVRGNSRTVRNVEKISLAMLPALAYALVSLLLMLVRREAVMAPLTARMGTQPCGAEMGRVSFSGGNADGHGIRRAESSAIHRLQKARGG